VRSLSEVGQTSSQSAGGPAGSAFAALSGASNSGLFSPNNYATNAANISGGVAAGALTGFLLGGEAGAAGAGPPGFVVGALIGGAIGAIASFVEDLSGGGRPATPRQLLNDRHPLYDLILGILSSLAPNESSAAEGFADPFTVSGVASFYYPDPTGKTGCKGYSYTDAEGFTAAMHKEIVGPKGKFPCGTMANVTYSPRGGVPRTIAVRVIDHGPYEKGRVIDLSPGAFRALAGNLKPGTIPVTVTFPEGPKPPLQAGD
jgi:rare lipoprotein A